MPWIEFIVSHPHNEPRSVEVDLERVTLGRAPSCAVPIDDRFLSRTHAELVARGGTWFVQDCGSENGTFVNGNIIEADVEVGVGDSIRIGNTEIKISSILPTNEEMTLDGVDTGEHTELVQVADLVLEEGEVEESAERTVIIYQLALELLADRSMEELFAIIVDHVMKVMSPSLVAIALLGDRGEALGVVQSRGSDEEELHDLSISKTLLSQIIEDRKVVSYTDVSANEALATAKSIVAQGIHSTLCAPLLVDDRVLGVLYLDYRRTMRIITEDDAQLAAQIARVAAIKLESSRLRAAVIEKERMDEALKVAQAIQMRMLPQELPMRTADSLFEISAMMRPAKQVGGDFYDFVHTDDDKLYFCIGDVSGKGMSAALLMAVTRALFRSMIHVGESPARIVSAVNRQLAHESEPDMFVTAFCGVLDLTSGALRYCNAGHNPPFVIGADRVVRALPTTPGLVLGYMDSFDFIEQTHTISPGDALYLDTDGIFEATNNEGELFSMDRLCEVLEVNASRSVSEIVSAMMISVEEFVAGAPQSDDLTLLAIRYLKAGART